MQIAPDTMMRLSLILPLLFFLFGGGIFLYSHIALGDVGDFGAGFMPAIVGALIAVLSALDFLSAWRATAGATSGAGGWHEIASVALMIAVVMFYIYGVDLLGFILTTSIIMVGLLLLFMEKNKLIASLAAIGLSAGIYYLFSNVLLVPLPAGTLF
ncbi:tripartite tricarboxylate transporter TctB family protein [Affinibrenneria salicis]|uniref:Tripartite tricarboxylate transporter TctB family protein n=1 Tax=Affinibrenneria salicis TaxID=2590031 RepID=A0A5J5FTN8_9GAMM|nr:tripartite tricarboxylate transporter TctB family protein [Affinibrenneria salicis]KAA8996403.1 tripartite tricarboxylate transporter TctB family protein [Affinibrenneria salicis]